MEEITQFGCVLILCHDWFSFKINYIRKLWLCQNSHCRQWLHMQHATCLMCDVRSQESTQPRLDWIIAKSTPHERNLKTVTLSGWTVLYLSTDSWGRPMPATVNSQSNYMVEYIDHICLRNESIETMKNYNVRGWRSSGTDNVFPILESTVRNKKAVKNNGQIYMSEKHNSTTTKNRYFCSEISFLICFCDVDMIMFYFSFLFFLSSIIPSVNTLFCDTLCGMFLPWMCVVGKQICSGTLTWLVDGILKETKSNAVSRKSGHWQTLE